MTLNVQTGERTQTNGRTDGRTLPSALSPSFAVDNQLKAVILPKINVQMVVEISILSEYNMLINTHNKTSEHSPAGCLILEGLNPRRGVVYIPYPPGRHTRSERRKECNIAGILEISERDWHGD